VDGERQRVDRFLWHARLARTRTLAAKLAASGHMRVNGQRIEAPGRGLKVGDVLTVSFGNGVRVMKVTAFAERRGSAETASSLYENITPPKPERDRRLHAGGARPTKRDRRAIERLQRSHDAG
jgi:ribosome-associated heat shock protein Hsp15